MSESRPLRVGVVGVGFGALVHIPGFQTEGCEVVAVCARRRERAEEAAAKYGIPNIFTDYDEMLRRDDIDAVSIVTPASLHHGMSIAALNAGKHVVCEKPLTANAGLAREMWQAAEANGRTAMVAHQFRFTSGRLRVKELLDEGYIGRPLIAFMRIFVGFPRPAEPPPFVPDRDSLAGGGGFLLGLGSHYIDGLRHWLGEVESVTGETTAFFPDRRSDAGMVKTEVDDTFACTLHFANGAIGQIVGTRVASHGSGVGVELYGSEGTLVTPHEGPGIVVNPPAFGVVLGARAGEKELQRLPIPPHLEPIPAGGDDRLPPFRLLVREFRRGIAEGKSPSPSFYDAYRVQQVMDAVRESSDTGRRVQIPAE